MSPAPFVTNNAGDSSVLDINEFVNKVVPCTTSIKSFEANLILYLLVILTNPVIIAF